MDGFIVLKLGVHNNLIWQNIKMLSYKYYSNDPLVMIKVNDGNRRRDKKMLNEV